MVRYFSLVEYLPLNQRNFPRPVSTVKKCRTRTRSSLPASNAYFYLESCHR